MTPQHSAYANTGTSTLRQFFAGTLGKESVAGPDSGDVRKGVEKIFDLSKLSNPPLRLVLGKDAIQRTREYIAKLASEVDAYEAWSSDLLYKGD